MCVCVYVVIKYQWRDMDPMRLVKQVLQLLYGNSSRYPFLI